MDGMSLLPASAPHRSAVELCRWTLDDFPELKELRAALREKIVQEMSVDVGDLFDRMAVVATELATNALRHGLPPTVVRLLRDEDRLILDVADHDLAAAPRVDEDRPLGAGGLGMRLAQTFAIDLGWYATDATKHVWASFPG
jgi:anti-sigma regulatory factor (Ser/Thr protein kinase)